MTTEEWIRAHPTKTAAQIAREVAGHRAMMEPGGHDDPPDDDDGICGAAVVPYQYGGWCKNCWVPIHWGRWCADCVRMGVKVFGATLAGVVAERIVEWVWV